MPKKKTLYPGVETVERIKNAAATRKLDNAPDFIGNAPNYDKFANWPCEKVLAYLNID